MSLGKWRTMKNKGWLLDLFLLFLLAVAAYVSSFRGTWQFDDFRCIVSNSHLRNLTEVWPFSPGRFLVFLTFWANYRFCALDTFWYHFVNLFIHILNGFLFYFFLLLLQEAAGKTERLLQKQSQQEHFESLASGFCPWNPSIGLPSGLPESKRSNDGHQRKLHQKFPSSKLQQYCWKIPHRFPPLQVCNPYGTRPSYQRQSCQYLGHHQMLSKRVSP